MSRERRILAVLAACSTLLGAALVFLDLVPGRFTEWAVIKAMCAFLWLIPLILIGTVYALGWWLLNRRRSTALMLSRGAAILLPLATAIVVVNTDLPPRLALFVSRDALQSLVANAPVATSQGEPLGRRVGLFTIDRYAAHPYGGVFFRTYVTSDMGGSVSHGIAYLPNANATPFGADNYTSRQLSGDWFIFSASDRGYSRTTKPAPSTLPSQ